MNVTARTNRLPYVAAALAFTVTLVLGAVVSHAPPSASDLGELGRYDVATPIATFFTVAGRFPTYVALCIVALAFGMVRRAWLRPAIVSIVGLVVVWQTSDLLKTIFHRPRPPHPLLAETSFAYPSGHADLSIFFYGFWAICAFRSALPQPARFAIAALAAAWTLAIGWSRLALGAHYPTDILGGYAYGAGWLGIAISVSYPIASSSIRKSSQTDAS